VDEIVGRVGENLIDHDSIKLIVLPLDVAQVRRATALAILSSG